MYEVLPRSVCQVGKSGRYDGCLSRGSLSAAWRGNQPPHGRIQTMLNRSMTNTLDRMLTLNRALDEAFTTSLNGGEAARVWVPAIDLIEKKDAYIVRAELP